MLSNNLSKSDLKDASPYNMAYVLEGSKLNNGEVRERRKLDFIILTSLDSRELEGALKTHKTHTRIDPKTWVGTKLMNAFEGVQYQIPFEPSQNTVQSQLF
jgi:hypothetical protein